MWNRPPLAAGSSRPDWLAALRAYPRQSRLALANWGIVLAGLLALQGLGALTSIVVARGVAPTEYGQYLSSLGMVSLLVVIPSFGMDTWLLAAGGLSAAQLTYHWRRLLRQRLALLALWLAGMAGLGLVLPADAYPWLVLWPTALAVALESTVLLAHAALRSVGRHAWVTGLQVVGTLALFALTLALDLRPGDIARFAFSRAAVWAVVMPITLALTWRLLKGAGPVASAAEPPRARTLFMISDLAAAVYTRAPLAIVALTLGSAGAAAFGPAASLITFTFLVPNALYLVVLPLLARVYQTLRPHFRRTSLVQVFVQVSAGVLISVATYYFAEYAVIRILGPNYAASVPCLLWLSPIPALKSLNFGLAAVLTAGDRQAYRTWAQVVCAVFNVGGGLLFVGPLGLAGVAAVLVASEALLAFGYVLGAFWPRAARGST